MSASKRRAFKVAANVHREEMMVASEVASDIADYEMTLSIDEDDTLWLRGGRANQRLYLGLTLEGAIRCLRTLARWER